MDVRRRRALKSGAGVSLVSLLAAGGFVMPRTAAAQDYNDAAFKTKTVDETLKALGGPSAAPSADIVIDASELAENGAVVPITVVSRIPNTSAIALLIEKNPNTLAGVFELPPGTAPEVSVRVKLAETSNVIALAKTADGKFYRATKEIKVTIGGCGG